MIECRADSRVSVELPVFFSVTGNTDTRQGTMFDISSGGCAVSSTVYVHPGTNVTLVIQAMDLAVPITVHSAAVRWVNQGEFGVEFLGLTDLDQSRLQRLLQIVAQSMPHT
jgi:c-di-GMP-binding flagellar brake protein YcgR